MHPNALCQLLPRQWPLSEGVEETKFHCGQGNPKGACAKQIKQGARALIEA
jgi:hypothetical protein